MTLPKDDLELSKSISEFVGNSYEDALYFMKILPDYSLIKFRTIMEAIILLLAQKFEIKLTDGSKKARIDELKKCQVLSSATADALHEVRQLGNKAAHLTRLDNESNEQINAFLSESVIRARAQLVSALEDTFSTLNDSSMIFRVALTEPAQHEFKELIHDALIKQDYRTKLKAGIYIYSIIEEERKGEEVIPNPNYASHINANYEIAASFFDSACTLSASIEVENKFKSVFYTEEDLEKLILENADTEALSKYAMVNLASIHESIRNKALNRVKAAANRGNSEAQLIYGEQLLINKDYSKSYNYLMKAKENENIASYVLLHELLLEAGHKYTDKKLAFEFLKTGIDYGCPKARTKLGISYYEGKEIEKNKELGKQLILKSAEEGCMQAIKFKETFFDGLYEELNQYMTQEINDIVNILGHVSEKKAHKRHPAVKSNKISPNQPCTCGSGKKYKKCCKGKPEIKPHEYYFGQQKALLYT